MPVSFLIFEWRAARLRIGDAGLSDAAFRQGRPPQTQSTHQVSQRMRQLQAASHQGYFHSSSHLHTPGLIILTHAQCDEAKPRCKKCLEYGVACNYGPAGGVSTGELVLSFGGVSHIEPPRKAAVSTNQTMMDMINYSLRQSPTSAQGVALVYQLDMDDMQLLDKFHSRTVLSIGTDKTRSLYQAESFRLACMVS